jgi:hypothetical protein
MLAFAFRGVLRLSLNQALVSHPKDHCISTVDNQGLAMPFGAILIAGHHTSTTDRPSPAIHAHQTKPT